MHGLEVVQPVDESGRFYDSFGWLHGLSTTEAAEQIIGNLEEKGVLVEAGLHEHRYPECWRCHTPLIFRIADDWFISVRVLRQQMLDANATVEWTPEYMGKRMDDWLRNMGDWNISRRRYYGLPLPFYPCACGHLNVIGSRAELEERALSGLDQLEELRRPWIDRVPVRCAECGEPVERIKEVGDVWLDAGIVPFSTLGWQNDERVPEGFGTGAAKGLTTADLPDHAYWEKWFPADWVSEMREQIRLWFYSQLFMSVVLTGGAPFRRVLGYEKMLDETGREMHASWGNTIPAEEAFERMGADVMRWQFAAQPPDRNLLFGFGPAEEIKRKLLTFWNSVKFFVDYAEHRGLPAVVVERSNLEGELDPLDRWLVERTHAFVARRRQPATRSWLRGGRHARRSRRTSTTSRTGTSVARGVASGTATSARRCTRSGTRSCRRCACWRRSFRSSPTTSGGRSSSTGRSRCISPAGPRSPSRTGLSWTRSPPSGGSSSSAGRRARAPASSCGSRYAGSSSRARASTAISTRSQTSCA